MANREPTDTTNLDIYGHEALPWSRAQAVLEAAHGPGDPFFLGTVRPDGRAHSAGIGVVWHDDALFFTCGPGTRKARNLAANPACTLSTRLPGIDLVIEGEARRDTDPATIDRVVARYNAVGWPSERDGDAVTAPFSAPSAGPPPWHVYRLTMRTVFGVAFAEPHGATRWRF